MTFEVVLEDRPPEEMLTAGSWDEFIASVEGGIRLCRDKGEQDLASLSVNMLELLKDLHKTNKNIKPPSYMDAASSKDYITAFWISDTATVGIRMTEISTQWLTDKVGLRRLSEHAWNSSQRLALAEYLRLHFSITIN